jgi:hypothetical protein
MGAQKRRFRQKNSTGGAKDMFGFIPIIIAILAGGLLLTFTSETFADGISRYVEATLDAIEYRLALRAQRQEATTRVRGGRVRAVTLSQAG